MPSPDALGGPVQIFHDYQVRFLDAEGVLIEDVFILAESLASANDRAGEIAGEIGAADFVITLKRELHERK